MRRFISILLICVFLCGCTSDKEPQIDFSVSAVTGEVEFVQANSALFNYKILYTNTYITKAGIAIFRNGALEKEYLSVPMEAEGQIHVTDLMPETAYTCKAVVEYTDPNSKLKETKYGTAKSFKTEPRMIKLNQPISYCSGTCPISISSNYGSIGNLTLEVSTTDDFSETALTKDFSAPENALDVSFTLPQGKYFCRIIGHKYGLISNVGIVRVITQRGNIVEENYVDLGVESLWSANFYSEQGKNKFPAATIKDFNGILSNGETFSGTQYDYLTQKLGKGYRTPSDEDFTALKLACIWEWDGDGFIISGCTGNAIKLRLSFSDYVATSTLYTSVFVYAYHITTPDGERTFSVWPYNPIDNGFYLWPIKDIAGNP